MVTKYTPGYTEAEGIAFIAIGTALTGFAGIVKIKQLAVGISPGENPAETFSGEKLILQGARQVLPTALTLGSVYALSKLVLNAVRPNH